MKTILKLSIFLLVINFISQTLIAQKASDVLEKGIRIKPGQKLFLQYSKTLKFDAAKSLQDSANPLDFTTLDDSTIFLVSKNGLNVYLQPLNPLNFSYNTENKFLIDPISEAATTAMGSIIDVLGSVKPLAATTKFGNEDINNHPELSKSEISCERLKKELQAKVEEVQMKLSFSKKSQITEVFNKLKSLDFASEENTITELNLIEISMIKIENHFKSIESLITEAILCAQKYYSVCLVDFNDKFIFNSILKDLATTIEEQEKLLIDLQTAYKLVKNAQYTASNGGGINGLK